MRPGPQPGLRGGEPAALLADDVGDRHPDLVEPKLDVPVLVVVGEDRQVAHDGDAGGVHRHDHHGLLAMRGRVRVGLAHHDQHRTARVGRAADPPLAPGDHVLVPVADDAGRNVGRVAAGDVGFGHRERRSDRALEQRGEPLRLLGLGAEQVEQFHVARVGCLTVDRLGGQVVAPARQLRDRRVLQLGQPGSRGQEQVPQTPGPRLGLELLDDRRNGVVVRAAGMAVGQVGRLGGEHVVAHEQPHLLLQVEGSWRQCGDHGVAPCSDGRSGCSRQKWTTTSAGVVA